MLIRAYAWIEKQIRKTRIDIGHAEGKKNADPEEIQGLNEKLEILEWISQAILKGRDGT